MKLTLDDLKPAESTFTLSEKQGVIFTLKKFTLADQIWAKRKFGDRLFEVLEKVEIEGIAEIAFHLLKDKTPFKDFEGFTECIVTTEDKIGVLKGLLATIGISQPIYDKLTEEAAAKGNE